MRGFLPVTSTQTQPRSKSRSARWGRCAALWTAAFLPAWLLAVSQLSLMPLGWLLILAVELVVSTAALVVTLRGLWPAGIPSFRRQSWAVGATCLAMVAFTARQNWSVLEPASSFYVHLPSFGILAHQNRPR